MGRKINSYSILLLSLLLITYHSNNVCYGQQQQPESEDDETIISNNIDNNNDQSSESESEQIDYVTPQIDEQYLYESFDNQEKFQQRWHKSVAHKADSSDLKYDGEWDLVRTQDLLKGKLFLIRNIFIFSTSKF